MSTINAAARQAQLQTWIQSNRPELSDRPMGDMPTEALSQAARDLSVPLTELLALREAAITSAGAGAMNAGAASSTMRDGLGARTATFGGQGLGNNAVGARMAALTGSLQISEAEVAQLQAEGLAHFPEGGPDMDQIQAEGLAHYPEGGPDMDQIQAEGLAHHPEHVPELDGAAAEALMPDLGRPATDAEVDGLIAQLKAADHPDAMMAAMMDTEKLMSLTVAAGLMTGDQEDRLTAAYQQVASDLSAMQEGLGENGDF